jgi:hypothetical protein
MARTDRHPAGRTSSPGQVNQQSTEATTTIQYQAAPVRSAGTNTASERQMPSAQHFSAGLVSS